MKLSYDQTKCIPMENVFLGTVVSKINYESAMDFYKNMSGLNPSFNRLVSFKNQLAECMENVDQKYLIFIRKLENEIRRMVMATQYSLEVCYVIKMLDGAFKPVDLDVDINDVQLLIPLGKYIDLKTCHFDRNSEGGTEIIYPYKSKVLKAYSVYSDLFFNLKVYEVSTKMNMSGVEQYEEDYLNSVYPNLVMLENAFKIISEEKAAKYIKNPVDRGMFLSDFRKVENFVNVELEKIFHGFGAKRKITKMRDACMRVVFVNMFCDSLIMVRIVDDSYYNEGCVRLSDICSDDDYTFSKVDGECTLLTINRKEFFEKYVKCLNKQE